MYPFYLYQILLLCSRKRLVPVPAGSQYRSSVGLFLPCECRDVLAESSSCSLDCRMVAGDLPDTLA